MDGKDNTRDEKAMAPRIVNKTSQTKKQQQGGKKGKKSRSKKIMNKKMGKKSRTKKPVKEAHSKKNHEPKKIDGGARARTGEKRSGSVDGPATGARIGY
jgi:hypothetical protein